MDEAVIIGRDAELQAISAFLEPKAESRALLVEGDAGIGKTTLWRWGVRQSRAGTCSPLRRPRRRRGDELTPSERRIGGLVAEGMTNKEVAAALVVADRTIESALTHLDRKLDVRSRTELARRLADPA